jgi:DNA-binding protein HU-beta
MREVHMTKAEIIEKMEKDADISKAAAKKALESFIESVKKTLKKGNRVALVGFGTFSVSKRAARKGRNPRTGETIKIKASKAPKFTAGKAFKSAFK